MRSAYPLLALTVLLTGCGDSSSRAYYRTRHIPSDVESTYRSVERQQWQGDPDVYELPATAPALEEEHYVRRNCETPGPKFKPQQIVGTHDEVRGSADPTVQVAGGWDPRPVPLGPVGPEKAYPVGGQAGAPPSGLRQYSQGQPASGWDGRPVPKRGANAIEATPVGGMRDMAKDDYCLPPAVPNPPPASR
jgi:hypothetical protein